MQDANSFYILNKPVVLLLFFALIILAGKSLSQEIPDTPIEHYVVYPKDPKAPRTTPTFSITGRVIGINNLEIVKGAAVVNIVTGEKTSTNDNGIYHINGSKGDTLKFFISKYSADLKAVKSPKEAINVILFRRKADNLPLGYTQSDHDKAIKEDGELLRILEKDAKLEGKWNY